MDQNLEGFDLESFPKDVQKSSGIYQIRNIKNNKRYIGSAINFKSRMNVHFSLLRRNKHHCRYLQNSFSKWGEENFVFEILDFVESEIERRFVEQKYLTLFFSELYNTFSNATGFDSETMKKITPIQNLEKNFWMG